MKFRALIVSLFLVGAGLVGPGVATSVAEPTRAVCTHTSSGSCIRGGEFCPRSKYGKSGYDAKGRRYVCKGNRTHPHWMKP